MTLDVGDNKIENKCLFTNNNCTAFRTITTNVRTIGGFELCLVGALEALTRGWRDDGDQGATVDEPLLVGKFVGNMP